MKRFLVFAFDQYYPCGGWGDFCGSYETVEAALADRPNWQSPEGYSRSGQDHFEIVDTTTGTVVERR